MTRVDWARARPILQGALQLPLEEREAFLEEACAGDEGLRSQVDRLLDEERRDAGFLAPPLESSKGLDPEHAGWTASTGTELGPYRLIESIGSGGMGDVWLAERKHADFRQRVAIKLIKRGMDTVEVLGRFRHERRVLAELEHAGIPRLIDGGATPDGRPFLVMEHVEGTPIDVHARDLELPARLQLFLAVCDAVQHAHEHGIVHRDLKPSNVLVTDAGLPKLLDFGIAKVLTPSEGLAAVDLTSTGQQLLTPRYASPEQVRGEPVTAATDVHALGLLLWELLVGRPALELDALTTADLEEAICERPLPPPSRAVEPAQTGLRRALAGDLDTICSMALRKEPARRYASAQQLAEDLRRHFEGRPVLARPDTVSYRVSKFVRRNRVLVGGVAATFLALVIGLVATWIQYRSAQEASRASRRTAYVASLDAAEAALREGRADLARQRLESAPEELRGWEWEHLHSRIDRSQARLPHGGSSSLALFDDGRTIAFASTGLMVYRDGEALVERVDCWPTGLAAEPGGSRLAWCDLTGALWVVDVERGESSANNLIAGDGRWRGPARANEVSWSPDGERLALFTSDGAIRILDPDDGALRVRFQEHEPSEDCGRMRWHPDGRRLISAGWDEHVQVYDTVSGQALGGWRAHTMGVEDLDVSSDGRWLLTASLDRTLKVWDLETRTEFAVLRPHEGAVAAARFLPEDGRVISASGQDLRITDLRTEETVARLLGSEGDIQELALAPASGRMATGSTTDVLLWSLDARDVRRVQTCEYSIRIRPSPSGNQFATASPDGVARLWRTADLTLERELSLEEEPVTGVAWHPAEDQVAVSTANGSVGVWDAVTGELLHRIDDPDSTATAVRFDPAGATLWAAYLRRSDYAALVREWQLPAGSLGSELQLERSLWIQSGRIAFDPGGRFLAASPSGGAPHVATARGIEAWGDDPSTRRGAVDARGPLLAVALDRSVRLFEDGRELARWEVPWPPLALAIHPSGERVALAQKEAVELWDPRLPARVAKLRGHVGHVYDLAWAADGATLFSIGGDGLVHLWETR